MALCWKKVLEFKWKRKLIFTNKSFPICPLLANPYAVLSLPDRVIPSLQVCPLSFKFLLGLKSHFRGHQIKRPFAVIFVRSR